MIANNMEDINIVNYTLLFGMEKYGDGMVFPIKFDIDSMNYLLCNIIISGGNEFDEDENEIYFEVLDFDKFNVKFISKFNIDKELLPEQYSTMREMLLEMQEIYYTYVNSGG